MRRIPVVAIATLLILPPTSAAETTASSCVDAGGGVSAATAAMAPNGGTSPSGASLSGGTPVSSDSGLTPIPIEPSDPAPIEAAQEPTPGEPGGEPQEPTGEPQEPSGEPIPGGEVPAGETGGGLPQTGLEVLKFVLLGLVLFLAGARLRVLVKRRRARWEPAPEEDYSELAPDGLPREAPTVIAVPMEPAPEEVTAEEEEEEEPEPAADLPASGWRERTRAALSLEGGWGEVDEWEFPDRDEEAPTGLLPRRRASSASD